MKHRGHLIGFANVTKNSGQFLVAQLERDDNQRYAHSAPSNTAIRAILKMEDSLDHALRIAIGETGRKPVPFLERFRTRDRIALFV